MFKKQMTEQQLGDIINWMLGWYVDNYKACPSNIPTAVEDAIDRLRFINMQYAAIMEDYVHYWKVIKILDPELFERSCKNDEEQLKREALKYLFKDPEMKNALKKYREVPGSFLSSPWLHIKKMLNID